MLEPLYLSEEAVYKTIHNRFLLCRDLDTGGLVRLPNTQMSLAGLDLSSLTICDSVSRRSQVYDLLVMKAELSNQYKTFIDIINCSCGYLSYLFNIVNHDCSILCFGEDHNISCNLVLTTLEIYYLRLMYENEEVLGYLKSLLVTGGIAKMSRLDKLKLR